MKILSKFQASALGASLLLLIAAPGASAQNGFDDVLIYRGSLKHETVLHSVGSDGEGVANEKIRGPRTTAYVVIGGRDEDDAIAEEGDAIDAPLVAEARVPAADGSAFDQEIPFGVFVSNTRSTTWYLRNPRSGRAGAVRAEGRSFAPAFGGVLERFLLVPDRSRLQFALAAMSEEALEPDDSDPGTDPTGEANSLLDELQILVDRYIGEATSDFLDHLRWLEAADPLINQAAQLPAERAANPDAAFVLEGPGRFLSDLLLDSILRFELVIQERRVHLIGESAQFPTDSPEHNDLISRSSFLSDLRVMAEDLRGRIDNFLANPPQTELAAARAFDDKTGERMAQITTFLGAASQADPDLMLQDLPAVPKSLQFEHTTVVSLTQRERVDLRGLPTQTLEGDQAALEAQAAGPDAGGEEVQYVAYEPGQSLITEEASSRLRLEDELTAMANDPNSEPLPIPEIFGDGSGTALAEPGTALYAFILVYNLLETEGHQFVDPQGLINDGDDGETNIDELRVRLAELEDLYTVMDDEFNQRGLPLPAGATTTREQLRDERDANPDLIPPLDPVLGLARELARQLREFATDHGPELAVFAEELRQASQEPDLPAAESAELERRAALLEQAPFLTAELEGFFTSLQQLGI